ncbi:hypothetical protein [Alteriqipengyuania sp. 357]
MLIRRIEKFLRETDMPATRFGRLAAQDPRFVLDLRNGRMPRSGTEARVDGFMSEWRARLQGDRQETHDAR